MIDDLIGVLLILQTGCYIMPGVGVARAPSPTHIEYNGFTDPRTGEQGFICDFSDRFLSEVQIDILGPFDGSSNLKFIVPDLPLGISEKDHLER